MPESITEPRGLIAGSLSWSPFTRSASPSTKGTKSLKTTRYKTSFAVPLSPTLEQDYNLTETLSLCRKVYNLAVEHRINHGMVTGDPIEARKQSALLPLWKQQYPELRQVSAQVLQFIIHQVARVFYCHHRDAQAGLEPEAPSLLTWQFDSFTFYCPLSAASGSFALTNQTVKLAKLGKIKAEIDSPVTGRPTSCKVYRSAGQWYAKITLSTTDNSLQDDPLDE